MLIEFITDNTEKFSYRISETSHNIFNGQLFSKRSTFGFLQILSTNPADCLLELKEHLLENNLKIQRISDMKDVNTNLKRAVAGLTKY